jgi:hypothetical protein
MDNRKSEGRRTEDWMQKRWRPLMAILYMAICGFDFILFPIGWTLTQAIFHGGITNQWQPLTLQGGGLIHVAFGAILGISAYGRTQEKLGGMAVNSPSTIQTTQSISEKKSPFPIDAPAL